MKKLFVLLFIILLFISCVNDTNEKDIAGKGQTTYTINLAPGNKLVCAGYISGNVSYLVRPMRPGEYTEVYELRNTNSANNAIYYNVSIVEHTQ